VLNWFRRRDPDEPETSSPAPGGNHRSSLAAAGGDHRVDDGVEPTEEAGSSAGDGGTAGRLEKTTSTAVPPAAPPPAARPATAEEGLTETAVAAATREARILCIANQKGGVGKTTTAVSLAAALAEAGARVLLVDLDPQGNATTGLGLRGREGPSSTYGVLVEGVDAEDVTEPTAVRGLHCLPSSLDLAGAEIELVPAFSRELRLRKALGPVRDRYDLMIVDCPPTLGLLTVNALVAADLVLLPIQCEYYALEGVGQLTRSIEMVRSSLNPALAVGGVVLTMYDGRTRLAEQVVDEVRSHFGPGVFRTVIPRTVRLSEAPGFGQPITVFDPSSRGARAYRRLADELAERLELELRSLSPMERLLSPGERGGDDLDREQRS
jgi:chromosome partitioning protein